MTQSTVTRQVMAKLCITVASTFFLRTIPPQNSASPGMVISNTNAVEASIHAVSPELIFAPSTSSGLVGAGGAAGAAAGAGAAGAAAGAAGAAAGLSWAMTGAHQPGAPNMARK